MPGDHTQSGMIALMPTPKDAARLAFDGGEPAEELHCTLFFLGDDVSGWDANMRNELEALVRARAALLPPLAANVFGAAHWNGSSDKPSWVWSVGDNQDAGDADSSLEKIRYAAVDALESTHERPELPRQHSPWVAHVCAQYTDDSSLLPELEKRLGPVTFDRIRLSFGDDDRDIPLDGSPEGLTAAAPILRRNPSKAELAARTDFALVHTTWQHAVDRTMAELSGVRRQWRMSIRRQVTDHFGSDPDVLEHLAVDPEPAADVLYRHMLEHARTAGQQAQREAEAQGVTVPEWNVDGSLAAALSGSDLLRSVARMSASSMVGSLVQSAKAKLTSLFGSKTSADAAATTVEQHLSDLSDAGPRDVVRGAMTAAQNVGRRAVFEAAPPTSLTASEILDNRCCTPCRRVDGTEYTTIAEATEAYPVMGYANCAGGSRCRGMLIGEWGSPVTAGAAETADGATVAPHVHAAPRAAKGESTVSETETLGGKPSKGTRKDKRLTENAYAEDADHFTTGVLASDTPWDGAASRFDDAEYRKSAAACDPGDGAVKERCFLPHHEPDGSLNVNGLHAAAQRVSSLKGHDPAAVARAKAHLRSHYKQVGEDAPDSVKATLADEVELALAAKQKPCPPGMMPDPDGDGDCVPAGGAEMSAGVAGGNPSPDDTPQKTAPWEGPIAVEGVTTGDGREFEPGKLTWQDPPLPLRWNKEDSHGGEPHTVAVNVGRIDKIWRAQSDDGVNMIMASGVLNLAEPDGQRAYDLIKGMFLKGVSIDADSIGQADMEFIWPDTGAEEGSEEDDMLAMLFGSPEKVIFHGGRIRGATLCDIPAFAEAYIALKDEAGNLVAGGAPSDLVKRRTVRKRAEPALIAHGAGEWRPPAGWFANPKLSLPTGIQVTDDGRVYGHAATWGTCHIGQEGVCVTPPHEDGHPYYMTGEVPTAEGSRIAVGQITVGTGHAPLHMSAGPATEHYEHTGHAVADVAVGNDAHGIWVAGAIRPGADPMMIHELRASGQVSGDWRRIGNSLRLVGLLAVNVPGFPVPKVRTRVASGVQQALVAAGRPSVSRGLSQDATVQLAFRTVMDALASKVHGKGI